MCIPRKSGQAFEIYNNSWVLVNWLRHIAATYAGSTKQQQMFTIGPINLIPFVADETESALSLSLQRSALLYLTWFIPTVGRNNGDHDYPFDISLSAVPPLYCLRCATVKFLCAISILFASATCLWRTSSIHEPTIYVLLNYYVWLENM